MRTMRSGRMPYSRPQGCGPRWRADVRVPRPVVLLAVLLAALGVAPTALAADAAPACSGRVLHVVAHEDDSLLFQSPDLLRDVRGGRCIQTVFLTAGDNARPEAYWHGREHGVEAAYAQMAQVPSSWSETTVDVAGHDVRVTTLDGRPGLSMVFLRLPDGGWPAGNGLPVHGFQSLRKLWESGDDPLDGDPGLPTIDAIDGSATYDHQGLIDTLAALTEDFEPQTVATLDYTASFLDGSAPGYDHPDHIVAGFFARAAAQAAGVPHVLRAYVGYPTQSMPVNVAGEELTAKRSAFYAYGFHDDETCTSDALCGAMPYGAWLMRQDVADVAVTGVVADAGYRRTADAGQQVELDGSASTAGPDALLTYAWVQTAGVPVQLSGADTATPSFTAPRRAGRITFALTVSDGVRVSAPATVDVDVPITADAGVDQIVASGTAVTLDGTASSHPDGAAITYAWSQVAGPSVGLTDASASKPVFAAPRGPASLRFALTVSDGTSTSTVDTVDVTVEPFRDGEANLAATATATASSERVAQGQTAGKAIDGVADGAPTAPAHEWVSDGERAGAQLTLTWDGWQVLDHVVLVDRPNLDDRVLSGTLTFSDGSTVSFGALPNEGGGGRSVAFAPRASTSLSVTIDTVSATSTDIGLAEVEAWGVPAGVPVADAGAEQAVDSGAGVALDATASSDPLGLPLTYRWTQTGGPVVDLSDPTAAQPSFTAPAGPATLSFAVVAANVAHDSPPAAVTVHVGASREGVGDIAALAAAVDEHAGGRVLRWSRTHLVDHVVLVDQPGDGRQISSGTLRFSDGSAVDFGAVPADSPGGRSIAFAPRTTKRLEIVVDGVGAVGTGPGLAQVQVWGVRAFGTPTARAGGDQVVDAGASVVLDGRTSTDPYDDPLTHTWTQTAGPPATLDDAHVATPAFVAPPGPATLRFALVVSNGDRASAVATVRVDVRAPKAHDDRGEGGDGRDGGGGDGDVPPPGGPPGDGTDVVQPPKPQRPAVGQLRASRSAGRTVLRMQVDVPASLTVVLQRARGGHRVGGRCRVHVPARVARRARRCTVWRSVGTLTRRVARAVTTQVVVPRRLGGRTLPSGAYRALVTPRAGTVAGSRRTVAFRLR